ncbi:acyltransferase family protein [Ancylobacter terrae]|uniref:acyltransferase family protein n=1 Tax=Ancylobacter sp. sgz301288 TaxID=3342077 RepID=UPI00385933A3
MGYRADIDGLRALAVAPVVLFHLQIAAFGGGFAGVDVFFVISGYLITALILADIEAGRFSLFPFLLRRSRRLFPALATVLAASSLAALVLFMPHELRSFGISLMAATLSVSNFVFSAQVGYFDAEALTKPLLHTWSLGVEGQFYLVIGAVFVALARLGRRAVVPVLAGLALLSFAISVEAVANGRDGAYYHLSTRGFELLIGALLATGIVPAIRHAGLRAGAALAGLALIGVAVFAFDAGTPFPGAAALVPCLGTALVLHSGAAGGSPVHRLLATTPLVALGRISYPVYLWHWPLIVFWTYATLELPSPGEQVAIAALTLALSVLTARYIEDPVRRRRWVPDDRALGRMVGAGSAAMVAVGLVATLTNGLPQRLSPEVQRAAAFRHDRPTLGGRCRAGEPDGRADLPCIIGDENAPGFDFALVGDSHAFATAAAIGERARRYGLKGVLLARVACPPLVGVERAPARRACAAHAAKMTETIAALDIPTVILVARWGLYLGGEGAGDARSPLSDGQSPGDDGAVVARGLARTLEALEGRRVAILGEVPEIGFSAPSVVARQLHFGRPLPLGPTVEAHSARQAGFDAALAPLLDAHADRLTLLDPVPVLCPDGRCLVVESGDVLYYDGNHLSRAGAARLAPAFDALFDDLYRDIVARDPDRTRSGAMPWPEHASSLP